MAYQCPFPFGHCLTWLLVTSTTLLLLGHCVNAFDPAFITRSTPPMRRNVVPTFTTPRHFSLQRVKALAATVVPDIHQNIPYNETSSSAYLEDKSHKTVKKDRQEFDDDYLFNNALNNLAKLAGEPRQPIIRRAVACEEMWKDFCSSPDKRWKPDTVSFNIVLKAWGRAGHVLEIEHAEHSTPKHLLDPDVHIFSSKDCAQHALDLLDQQEKLCDAHNNKDDESASSVACPDTSSYNSVMEAWAKTRTPEALPEVQALMKRLMKRKLEPDRISFSALIEAHATAKEVNRLEAVQKIWNHMESHDSPRVRPNARSLIALMRVYSRAATDIQFSEGRDSKLLREIGDQTMHCLQRQQERYEESQRPDDELTIFEFVAAMDVLARLGTIDAAHRAESLWQKLDTLGIDKSTYAYSAVITAWSRVTPVIPEASQRVADLLDEFWSSGAARSNNRPFVAALRGYSRSKFPLAEQPNKAIVALEWVKRLREAWKEKRGPRPTHGLYHAAMDCCKNVVDSTELYAALAKDGSTTEAETSALKIAFALLKAMEADKVTPNNDTYFKLLKCTQELLPTGDESTKIAESVFLKAKDAGVADQKVIRCLRETVKTSYWDDFVLAENIDDGRRRIDWSKIPRDWSRNVR